MPITQNRKPRGKPIRRKNPNATVTMAFESEMLRLNAFFRADIISLRELVKMQDFANQAYANCLKGVRSGEPRQTQRFLELLTQRQRELFAEQKRERQINSEIEKNSDLAKQPNKGRKKSQKTVDPGLLRIKREGFVKPTEKGIRLAEKTALGISGEINSLRRDPIRNSEKIAKLENNREALISYIHGKLPRSHKIAEFMEEV